MSHPNCPECGSSKAKKNGSVWKKKQKYQCNACKRQFVENPANIIISDFKKNLTGRLLLEKISLAVTARAAGVSGAWLQNCANRKYSEVPRQAGAAGKPKGRPATECDGLWSFARRRADKAWVWAAADRDTRECAGCFIGGRDRAGAQGLRDPLPSASRQCAAACTGFREAYNDVFPENRRRAAGKETGRLTISGV